ncbi:unnamed protein product [Colias eurytheme]|nr:unnamed protein product [Colias eurytheme]
MFRLLILFSILHIAFCEFCIGQLCAYASESAPTICENKKEVLMKEIDLYERIIKELKEQIISQDALIQQQQKDCQLRGERQGELCLALHKQQQQLIQEQQRQLQQKVVKTQNE